MIDIRRWSIRGGGRLERFYCIGKVTPGTSDPSLLTHRVKQNSDITESARASGGINDMLAVVEQKVAHAYSGIRTHMSVILRRAS